MKKKIALILAIVFVVALFAGCGGNTGTTPPADGGNAPADGGNAPANGGNAPADGGNAPADGGSTPDDGGSEPADAPVDEGPYCLAKGKWQLNEDGYASEKFVYEKPLSTTDEVFTRWTTCYTPQYIPEGGWATIPAWKGVEDYTGVHMEYDIVSSDTRETNFSVLVASDEIHDVMDQASFFWKGTQMEAFDPDEGYWANLVDYKDYMPNYLFELWDRSFIAGEFSTLGQGVQYAYNDDENIMAGFFGMLKDPAPGMGYWYRQDLLTEMGWGTVLDEIRTNDDLERYYEAIQVNYPGMYGACIYSTGELGCQLFSGYNTVCYTAGFDYVRAEDGVLKFNGTEAVDKEVVEIVRNWIAKGYVHPNWQTFEQNQYIDSYWANNEISSACFTPSEVGAHQSNCIDLDCDWQTATYARKYEGQVLDYGHTEGAGFHFGSCWISRDCENIPLMVSYWDWWFSEFGADWTSWGPEGENTNSEGYLWFYNEDGERQITDWCLNHEGGMAWIMCVYGANGLVETCLQHHMRNYAYPEGQIYADAFRIWTEDNYGGRYDLPDGISYTTEETDDMNAIYTDLQTFFEENYVMFLTGDKSMDEWDQFQSDLENFNFSEYKAIRQGAYDRFMATA